MNFNNVLELLNRARDVSPSDGDSLTTAIQMVSAGQHGTPPALDSLGEIATAVTRAAEILAVTVNALDKVGDAVRDLFSADDAAELAALNASQPTGFDKIKPGFMVGSVHEVTAGESIAPMIGPTRADIEAMTPEQMRALLLARHEDGAQSVAGVIIAKNLPPLSRKKKARRK